MNDKWFQPADFRSRRGPRASSALEWHIVLEGGVELRTKCEPFVQMLLDEGRIALLIENGQLTAVS